eukprot:1306068-Rhodomonas_salina.1
MEGSEARKAYKRLAEDFDPTRKKYWCAFFLFLSFSSFFLPLLQLSCYGPIVLRIRYAVSGNEIGDAGCGRHRNWGPQRAEGRGRKTVTSCNVHTLKKTSPTSNREWGPRTSS